MKDTRLSSLKSLIPLIFGLLLLGVAQTGFSATSRGAVDLSDDTDRVPTGKGWGERPDTLHQQAAPDLGPGAASTGTVPSGNGIDFHGGPVMTAPVNVYYIWYGKWSGNSAPTILNDLASGLKGSPYYNINTTYTDNLGNPVINNADVTAGNLSPVLAGSLTWTGSYKTRLSDSDIKSIVTNSIGPGKLPSDPNGVYFVLTSKDIAETSGFCTRYCGWHTHGTIWSTDIKYSFVGNPDRCPNACAAQTTGPNGNAGADGMASIIAHELEEAVTDPDLNAWYDSKGYENADKCAWTFGTTSTAANGAKYNVTLGSRNFLIQQNWVNAGGGYCSMSYTTPPAP